MTTPTVLSPWYVVQRVRTMDLMAGDPFMEYWTTDGEGAKSWTTNAHAAMIFMQLQSATRVASAEAAEVRVLYDKDGYHEFRPREIE